MHALKNRLLQPSCVLLDDDEGLPALRHHHGRDDAAAFGKLIGPRARHGLAARCGTDRRGYFAIFRMYASSLSFSYLTVLRKRLSSR